MCRIMLLNASLKNDVLNTSICLLFENASIVRADLLTLKQRVHLYDFIFGDHLRTRVVSALCNFSRKA